MKRWLAIIMSCMVLAVPLLSVESTYSQTRSGPAQSNRECPPDIEGVSTAQGLFDADVTSTSACPALFQLHLGVIDPLQPSGLSRSLPMPVITQQDRRTRRARTIPNRWSLQFRTGMVLCNLRPDNDNLSFDGALYKPAIDLGIRYHYTDEDGVGRNFLEIGVTKTTFAMPDQDWYFENWEQDAYFYTMPRRIPDYNSMSLLMCKLLFGRETRDFSPGSRFFFNIGLALMDLDENQLSFLELREHYYGIEFGCGVQLQINPRLGFVLAPDLIFSFKDQGGRNFIYGDGIAFQIGAGLAYSFKRN